MTFAEAKQAAHEEAERYEKWHNLRDHRGRSDSVQARDIIKTFLSIQFSRTVEELVEITESLQHQNELACLEKLSEGIERD